MRTFALLLCVAIAIGALSLIPNWDQPEKAGGTQEGEPPDYPLHYHVELDPQSDMAQVSIELEHGGLVSYIDFNVSSGRYSDIQGNGKLDVKDGRALWHPPAENARLTLKAKISHERDHGSYDALMTDDWAIFRGDDVIPAARVATRGDAESRAQLSFTLPDHWTSVTTGWDRLDGRTFAVENPERRFSRPTGWMIAGRLGTRRDQLGETQVAVSAPRGSDLRRMDVLTFMNIAWPELESAFGKTPPKLTIVGHNDPMWRGGLSGPNSLFLHAERPLVSENGTSPLIHELFHVITRLRGEDGHDWIVEGLAEYYSFELLHRAGAMTDKRRARVLDDLDDWGEDVDTLIKAQSTGANTARAVLLFNRLDQEIQAQTDEDASLDGVVRALIKLREVSLSDLRREAERLTGSPLETLDNEAEGLLAPQLE